jgi:hypothetical protein
MTSECGGIGGMIIDMEIEIFGKLLPQLNCAHYEHNEFGIEFVKLRREVDDRLIKLLHGTVLVKKIAYKYRNAFVPVKT